MNQVSNTQIQGVSHQQLMMDFDALLQKRLSQFKPSAEADDKFLTRQDVADMFGVSLPTVHAWDNAGILNNYKIGTKTFYKKSEVLACAKPIKREL